MLLNQHFLLTSNLPFFHYVSHLYSLPSSLSLRQAFYLIRRLHPASSFIISILTYHSPPSPHALLSNLISFPTNLPLFHHQKLHIFTAFMIFPPQTDLICIHSRLFPFHRHLHSSPITPILSRVPFSLYRINTPPIHYSISAYQAGSHTMPLSVMLYRPVSKKNKLMKGCAQ